ncbi:MAG: hypothetical protein IPL61_25795 [Myxococcales bacterium]|nr:hypothetical protein [Myxococcales bacterium]
MIALCACAGRPRSVPPAGVAPITVALAAIDPTRPAAAADRLVDEWLATDAPALIVGLEHARLDTLCAIGAALDRRGQLARLDPSRQVIVRQCLRTWAPAASTDAGMIAVAAAGIVLRTADLERTSPTIDRVIEHAAITGLAQRIADHDLARLLADGLLAHVDAEQFFASAGGRLVWLVALALRAPTVDPDVVWLARQLTDRAPDSAAVATADRAALSTELATRWHAEGDYLYLDSDVYSNSGDAPRGAWVLLDDWAMFLGVPLLVNRGDYVVPPAWRALPAGRRVELARASQRHRSTHLGEWQPWLAAQRAALGL